MGWLLLAEEFVADLASCLEDDIGMSEDDESPWVNHWHTLPFPNPPSHLQSSFTPQHGLRPSTLFTAAKWPVLEYSDGSYSANVDCLLPVAKTSKYILAVNDTTPFQPSLPHPGVSSLIPSLPSPHLPVFVQRDDDAKLSFSGNLFTDAKLRCLSLNSRVFQSQRELAEVKMAAVTSRFVYISRKNQNIIDRVSLVNYCLCLTFLRTRPTGLPSYILTHFTAEGHLGVCTLPVVFSRTAPTFTILLLSGVFAVHLHLRSSTSFPAFHCVSCENFLMTFHGANGAGVSDGSPCTVQTRRRMTGGQPDMTPGRVPSGVKRRILLHPQQSLHLLGKYVSRSSP